MCGAARHLRRSCKIPHPVDNVKICIAGVSNELHQQTSIVIQILPTLPTVIMKIYVNL